MSKAASNCTMSLVVSSLCLCVLAIPKMCCNPSHIKILPYFNACRALLKDMEAILFPGATSRTSHICGYSFASEIG
ncbi:hypothetical protein F383_12756 [Gossypium arboreum]|uniref:Secreted protein n=1 Tax=Gossypium arboreum TaxID=29729 RepID=A0A0B0NFV2_GOSAR|nr:hypothetical protein F383_12756 [Gossypium arboreum]